MARAFALDTGGKGADRQGLTAAASTFLAGQHIAPGTALTDALAGLYADAYLVGAVSAATAAGDTGSSLDAWKPGGDPSAQAGIKDHGVGPGVTLLAAGTSATAAALTASRVKAAARALADGTAAGHTPHAIGTAMHAAIADPDRAYAAAITETTRAVAAGAADTYRRTNVTLGRWQTEPDGRVCPVCDTNAAAGPVPIGHPYPSGDTAPPAHPRCRCAVLPA